MTENGDPSQAALPEDSRPAVAAFALSLVDAQPVEPPVGSTGFTTVIIGASAGGIDALRRFFGAMPADSGCAFVIVTHLARDRESMLAPLLGRVTPMPTVQVDGELALAPNHVYVSAPGQLLEVRGGRLVPRAMLLRPARALTVDHCMISLAADQRDRVVGIVLSGADGDGALGVKAIKSEGGLTLAQKPQTAAHPGMPESAVATGSVDAQLNVEDMPAAVLAYVRKLGLNEPPPTAESMAGDDGLAAVLATQKARFGIDFSGYKTPMLLRRMHRRMALVSIDDVAAYKRRIADDDAEARALNDDFLINVTEFFREPESWNALANDVLPAILQSKEQGASVRVWVPACSTGQEAYSIAMLLLEQPLVAERGLKLMIFGTDVDAAALDIARRGQYEHTIEPAVSQERLRRFFVHSGDRYEVRKDVRASVMFAAQNLTKDPPFSRMDLISCRNVLIYMDQDLQRRVLQTLHFALDGSGYLALGKSETASAQPTLFTAVSNKARLFRRAGGSRPFGGTNGDAVPPWQSGDSERRERKLQPEAPARGAMLRDTLRGREVAAAVLTNREGQTLYFMGVGPPFMRQPAGEPTVDLFSLLDDGLRAQVRSALYRAVQRQAEVEALGTIRGPQHAGQRVRLTVLPGVGSTNSGLFAVCFETVEGVAAATTETADAAEATAIGALEDELRTMRRELRATIEELEASNEEMKVANEEATSVNEELQSSNEELETSKEEMQSMNEELTSVNEQLQAKVHELERTNDDIVNLLTSTHIPTLFLDRALRIRRFTPAATQLFRLLASDIDRPLTDIAADTDLPALLADVDEVLRTQAPIEREARSATREHWLRRTLPYVTRDDVAVSGVVVTFTNVTQVRQASEAMRRFAAVMQATGEAMVILDRQHLVVACNPAAQRLYGVTETDLIGSDFQQVIPEHMRALHAQQARALLAGAHVPTQETLRLRPDGTTTPVASSPCVVQDDEGRPQGIAMIERDITQAKEVEAELRRSEAQYRALAQNASVLIFIAAADGTLRFVNAEFCTFVAEAAGQLQGRRWVELFQPDDQPTIWQALAQRRAHDGQRVELTARLVHSSGRARWMKLIVSKNATLADGSIGWTGSMVDVDDQVASEQALQGADRRKDEFLAMLGHELRNPLVPIRNAAAVLDRVAGGDPRIGWVRDTLVRQVGHVTRLVDDLLDISMVTRGALRLHMEPLELRHVIEQAVDGATPLLQRKHHKLSVSLPDEPVWLQGDTIRLTQVFDNLLTNAAKYTDDGGDLSIDAVCSGDMATVTVCDNGLGIPPAMLSRIFDLFVQDERSVDRSQGGLGIGLALVRRLVDLHGGTVHADSAGQGKGSQLVVRLPLLREARAAVPVERSPEAATSGGRVLIVDDDVDGGRSLMVLLRLFGYDAEYAADLPQALAAARRQRPQVVLLDIAMPHADGYEVAARLRALPELDGARTAYIAITGFTQPEDHGRSKSAGFVRHLVKPVEPGVLDGLLRSLIDAPAAAAAVPAAGRR